MMNFCVHDPIPAQTAWYAEYLKCVSVKRLHLVLSRVCSVCSWLLAVYRLLELFTVARAIGCSICNLHCKLAYGTCFLPAIYHLPWHVTILQKDMIWSLAIGVTTAKGGQWVHCRVQHADALAMLPRLQVQLLDNVPNCWQHMQTKKTLKIAAATWHLWHDGWIIVVTKHNKQMCLAVL